MIQKPSQLTGEVKSFIGWLESFEYEPTVIEFKTRSEYGLTVKEKLRAMEDDMVGRREMIKFLNQPIDIGEAMQLFKGWLQVNDKNWTLVDSPYRIFANEECFKIYKQLDAGSSKLIFFTSCLPSTLSSLIVFLQEAGITLQWKE